MNYPANNNIGRDRSSFLGNYPLSKFESSPKYEYCLTTKYKFCERNEIKFCSVQLYSF